MTTEFTFEVQGMEGLSERMKGVGTKGQISLNEALRAIGKLFVPAGGTGPLADETPVRTGKLRRSTVFQIMGGPTDQRLEIRQAAQTPTGQFYGWFVREGTRPHEIRPRFKKVLRFKIGDKTVFAKLVHHPGTMPNPYHRRVLERLRSEVQQIVNEAGQKVAAYLSGK